ncbi:hypothetical protein [Acidocella sp.]|uniref:hypothetical protein n=1 Tax=Acidocella sp. TaxID=50710 RepID=UPI00260D09CC|nr:hypothetical protein [Acidocella sp.]MDD2795854.1 hypothetical protein [Acidocella sp.]
MLTFLVILAVSVVALLAAQALDIECNRPPVRRGKAERPAPAEMFADTLAGLY